MRIRDMKTKTLIFFTLLTVIISGCATSVRVRTMRTSVTPDGRQILPVQIESPEKEYRVGEKFIYAVTYLGIGIGEAVLHVKEITTIKNREVYHIEFRAYTNKFFSAIYRVEDVVHSYVDVEKLHSLRFEKNLREGMYRADEVMEYDQENHTAVYSNGKVTKHLELAEDAQDALSAIYYFRLQDIVVGMPLIYNVNADEKNYRMTFEVLRAGTVSISGMETFPAVLIEPKARLKGIFTRKGRAWVWFSADSRRIPLVIKVKFALGTVNTYLKRIEEELPKAEGEEPSVSEAVTGEKKPNIIIGSVKGLVSWIKNGLYKLFVAPFKK